MESRHVEPWRLSYRTWDPNEEPLREALTTLGNGNFATRGAAEEAGAGAGGGPHYPGTYLAGGYDRQTSEIAGRAIVNEDLVNWPNWIVVTFRVDGGAWLDLGTLEILEYERTLDLARAVLSRRVRFRDEAGRAWQLETARFVSMAEPHAAAIRWKLTPEAWSGEIEIRSALDGDVSNEGVARYRDLEGRHLDVLEAGEDGDAMVLVARTRQSHIVMAQAATTEVRGGAVCARRLVADERAVAQHVRARVEAGETIRVDKRVALLSSKDRAISEPRVAAVEAVGRLASFDTLRARHERAWKHLWWRADVDLESDDGDGYAQLVLRLHLFHLLSVASPHTMDRDVGIPARGLHGEAYRGHIFWDELFVFPLLILQLPEVARALLLYRWRRLDAARHAAREAGYGGAMFPWQSGSDGREESQVMHLNPRTGEWTDDDTHLQRHVGIAIAWNVWRYYEATDDLAFMARYGAEMLLEIARFWASAGTPRGDGRIDIRGVVGPDEFHTRYPGAERPGLDNNTYTNVMAAWVLETARCALERLTPGRRRELCETLELGEDELGRWQEMSRRIVVPWNDDGVPSQFEGWEALDELDWVGLRQRHGDIQRLDRILPGEGDDPNRYKASKQADVLMLLYLLPAETLREIVGRLGYELPSEAIPRMVGHYLERTSHGSTLSRVVHAWVLARSNRRASWRLFCDALASDIEDIQGGTTSEGIHLGAMAGAVDLVLRCYAGITTRDGALWIEPQLPDGLRRLRVRVRYRGHWVGVSIDRRRVEVSSEEGPSAPVSIGYGGALHRLASGALLAFELEVAAA